MRPKSHQYPSYRHHKASGQAVVTLNGMDIYLGSYGTKHSRDQYDRRLSEWLTAGRTLPSKLTNNQISIAELLNGFRKSDDLTQSHAHDYVAVIRLLVQYYGRSPVSEFGPLAMKSIRDEMIKRGLKRSTINCRIHILRRIFRWGVSNELVPSYIWESLKAVEGLRAGKSKAIESEPVQPVSEDHVEKCLPFMPAMVRDMVQIQLLTGMRPGELVIMRSCDIDTSNDIWIYRPSSHKTDYLGHERTIVIGPKAKVFLSKYLKTDLTAPIFSPKESENLRRNEIHAIRKTPPKQGNTIGTNRVRKPKRSAGEMYDVCAYRNAIYRGCDKAFPLLPDLAKQSGERDKEWRQRLGDRWNKVLAWRNKHRWHPHQLRHTAATKIRDQFDLEAAQKCLGHKHASVTQIYAKQDMKKAIEVARMIG